MASSVVSSRPGQFKTVSVSKRVPIKQFVQEKGLDFKKGCGYYQLTKPETIQDYKKVVARRKSDGSYITGDAIRKILGIKSTAKKFSLDLSNLPDFDIFVQSTSVNRVLLPGTDFLYEEESNSSDKKVCKKLAIPALIFVVICINQKVPHPLLIKFSTAKVVRLWLK